MTNPDREELVKLADLRSANIARQKEWDAGNQLTLAYRGNELAGEVGEACNVIKKLERERLGIAGSRDTVAHLAEELADVVICADLIAMHEGIDLLGESVPAKFNATSEKVGLKTRLASSDGGVKVRELEWGPYPNPVLACDDVAVADITAFGGHKYQVQRDPNAAGYIAFLAPQFGSLFWESKGHDTLDAAKAAAQADYEARIKSALVEVPAVTDPWVDTRLVRFDDTIVFGHGGFDFDKWESLRWECHTRHGSFAVWKSDRQSWSLYGGKYGVLALDQYSSESQAKAEVEQLVLSYDGEITPPPADAGMREALGKYAEVLVPFVSMMAAELRANSGKGDRPGWLQMDRKTGLLEIFYHLAKLQKATKDNDQDRIREYGADVANMAMMLVDICGALPNAALTAPGATTKSDGLCQCSWSCVEASNCRRKAALKSDVETLAATTAERPGTVTSEPEPSTSDPSSTRSEVTPSLEGDAVERVAQRAVRRIIDDLTDRRGLRHAWDEIDDNIRAEIESTWTMIIRTSMPTGLVPDEAATALTEARAEIERLRARIDSFLEDRAFHESRASKLRRLEGLVRDEAARALAAESELSTLRARVREVVGAFLNIRDQFPESSKLILKKFDGFTPISVTVTKDQFRAARQLMEEVK